MWLSRQSLAAFAFLFFFVHEARSIYDTQYGDWEWHNEQIGPPIKMAYSPSVTGDAIIFSTASHLAAVDASTGSLLWRRQFPVGFHSPRLLLCEKFKVISAVSGEGSLHISVWDSIEGYLEWDKVLLRTQRDEAEEMTALVLSNFKYHFLLKLDNVLHAFTQDGEIGWSYAPQTGGILGGVLRKNKFILCVVEHEDRSAYHVVHLDSSTGSVAKIIPPAKLPSSAFFTELSLFSVTPRGPDGTGFDFTSTPLEKDSTPSSIDLSPSFSSTSSVPKVVVFRRQWPDSSFTLEQTPVQENGEYRYASIRASPDQPMEIVSSWTSSSPLNISKSLTSVVAFDNQHPGTPSTHFSSSDSHEFFLRIGQFITNPNSGVVSWELSAPTILAPTSAPLTFLKVYNNWLIASSADHSLFVYSLSKDSPSSVLSPLWVREEALASIQFASFVDFPPKPPVTIDFTLGIDYLWEKWHSFSETANSLITSDDPSAEFQSGLMSLMETGQWTPMLSELEEAEFVSDDYGFRKVIVVATSVGKVLGISSHSGKVLWSRYFGSSLNFTSLLPHRAKPHHAADVILSIVKEDQTSTVVRLNSFTGEILEKHQLSFPVQKIEVLPFPNDFLLVFFGSEGEMYPWSGSGDWEMLQEHSGDLFLHRIDKEGVAIHGYRYRAANDNDKKLVPVEGWTNVLGVAGIDQIEEVLLSAATTSNTHRPVPAPLFVGDVEYTAFLNPNVLFVVTSDNSGGSKEKGISVFAIDGITGAILYQTFHHQATGPVHLVREDHWLIYQYYNAKHSRNEVSCLEFYVPPPNPGRPPVVALFQTYVIDFDVSGMGVSQTLFTATSKDIIFATTSGSIIKMIQTFLSAQRPSAANFTNAHREKLLAPYEPRVMLHPRNYVSSNRTIFGAKKIVTAPAHMESSSLVFCFGHDNYFSIVHPSKTFDLLESDFNYIGLVGTVIVVAITTVVMKILATRKELNTAWNKN